jgi:membrane-associated phospholipid phosphatase
VAASLASQIIRGPLGRSRPYSSNAENGVADYTAQYDFHWFQGFTNFKYRAFPSIHSASAFAVATVYTLETQRRAPNAVWIVGPIAYALAAGPGIARMYNGQHWASDIVSGAFLGTLAGAKIVRYNHEIQPTNALNRFFLGNDGVQLTAGGAHFGALYSLTF